MDAKKAIFTAVLAANLTVAGVAFAAAPTDTAGTQAPPAAAAQPQAQDQVDANAAPDSYDASGGGYMMDQPYGMGSWYGYRGGMMQEKRGGGHDEGLVVIAAAVGAISVLLAWALMTLGIVALWKWIKRQSA